MSEERDESKLPRWAQIRLENLRSDVKRALRQMEMLAGGSAVSSLRVAMVDRRISIPADARVEFKVGDGPSDYLTIYRSPHDGNVITATITGGEGLIVQPWSSNVVKLTQGRLL